jgi:hypothetical protein
MTLRQWLGGVVLLVLAYPGESQNRTALEPDESVRFNDIREGRRALVKDPSAQEAEKNITAIKKKARFEVANLIEAANTDRGSNEARPISQVVRRLAGAIVDPLGAPGRKLTEGQRDLNAILAQEMVEQLKPIFGTAEKPGNPDILLRINAAREISILGRTGQDVVARVAIDIIKNPNEHDAVRLYALEALGHVFAVPHPEREGESHFADKNLEVEAVQTLINFIARPVKVEDSMSQEEIDAFRYLRREAVRSLGKVRKPIFRDKDGKMQANPAIWLLRVANGDRRLTPSPGLSERVEALAGYLFLQGDKFQNMDYAAGFVATAVRDLVGEFLSPERQNLEKPRGDDVKLPERTPQERDYHPWRLTTNRLQVGLGVWRENYEHPAFGPRPADVKTMMDRLIDTINRNILQGMLQNQRSNIILEPLDNWLRTTQFPSRSLFNEDPEGTVVRP